MNASQAVNSYPEMKQYARPSMDYQAMEPNRIVREPRDPCSVAKPEHAHLRGTHRTCREDRRDSEQDWKRRVTGLQNTLGAVRTRFTGMSFFGQTADHHNLKRSHLRVL